MTRLRVEVVYARSGVQDLVVLELEAGALAWQAVEASGVISRHPELAGHHWRLGISGRQIQSASVLRDGDRVEILRPLTADPGESRRRRARAARKRR